MLILGSVILFSIGLWREPTGLQDIAHAPYYAWVTFFSSAILSTAVGQMVYNSAIGRIGPAEASIFFNLSTFFALVGSAVLLGEVIKVVHLFGLVVIVTGVLCGSGAVEETHSKKKTKGSQTREEPKKERLNKE